MSSISSDPERGRNRNAAWPAVQDYLRPGSLQLTSQPPLSLYVHLPWCLKKCPYCDFNSHGLQGELPESAYVAALLADLQQALPLVWGRSVESVFFGGGTPSLFSPDTLAGLISQIRRLAAAGIHVRDHAGGQPRHLRSASALPLSPRPA